MPVFSWHATFVRDMNLFKTMAGRPKTWSACMCVINIRSTSEWWIFVFNNCFCVPSPQSNNHARPPSRNMYALVLRSSVGIPLEVPRQVKSIPLKAFVLFSWDIRCSTLTWWSKYSSKAYCWLGELYGLGSSLLWIIDRQPALQGDAKYPGATFLSRNDLACCIFFGFEDTDGRW